MLEMGEPVKIVDLAHNMIRLAGYEPEVDIAIEFVGARPGEKLHEELFNSDERPQPTAADRIVRAVRKAPLDPEWVNGTLSRLEALVGCRRRGRPRRSDRRAGHAAAGRCASGRRRNGVGERLRHITGCSSASPRSTLASNIPRPRS